MRVVDAATGKPLKGALVMVVWQAEDTEIDGMKNVVAIREVATGADGSFTVPADFEATAPPRTLPATVWAFAHDHLPSSTNPHWAGLAADDFRTAGRVIELSPATTEKERARALNILIAAPATWSGRLDNDSGNRNKKRRVSKVPSSSSSKSKYMQTSHPVNAARFATGVLSMKLRFICPRAPGHLNRKTAQHPLKQ